MSDNRITLEELHGDVPVATISMTLYRSGVMKVEGSITDEAFVMHMIDTCRDTLANYHAQQKLGKRSPIIVPADATSLVGTPEEQRLLRARDELDNLIIKDQRGELGKGPR
jgi:hypothetical protein